MSSWLIRHGGSALRETKTCLSLRDFKPPSTSDLPIPIRLLQRRLYFLCNWSTRGKFLKNPFLGDISQLPITPSNNTVVDQVTELSSDFVFQCCHSYSGTIPAEAKEQLPLTSLKQREFFYFLRILLSCCVLVQLHSPPLSHSLRSASWRGLSCFITYWTPKTASPLRMSNVFNIGRNPKITSWLSMTQIVLSLK